MCFNIELSSQRFFFNTIKFIGILFLNPIGLFGASRQFEIFNAVIVEYNKVKYLAFSRTEERINLLGITWAQYLLGRH
ncbi:hypothetical protein BpHYR1_025068 [Brachionus plicatilis]|uniref:Uncharacterized protein n=1 Tax=Brachionus plicatilis TaxID=10195 RepID=A0A3M7SEM8_BRAPC|nr:hypothetical protein BpHYR1_025068 [Brachionus plicatilis]